MKRMWYSSWHSFHYYVFHSLGFQLEYHILFIIMSSTHLVFNLNITFFSLLCLPQWKECDIQVENQVSGRHNNEKNVIFKLKTKWVEDIIMKRMWYSSWKPSDFHYYVFHSLGFQLEYHILFIIMSSTHLVFNLNITFFSLLCLPLTWFSTW
jgi:hypothetical protein